MVHQPTLSYWTVPPKHKGETIAVIGGGPSLRHFDVEKLRPYTTVVVNNSYKIAPWAKYGLFIDKKWWVWNGQHFMDTFAGQKITTNRDLRAVNHPSLKRLIRVSAENFSDDPQRLVGRDSGCCGIHLAYHLGASRILLAGFDLSVDENGETHWHNEHKTPSNISNYELRFGPKQQRLTDELRQRGVEVLRVTQPGLQSLPFVSIDDLDT